MGHELCHQKKEVTMPTELNGGGGLKQGRWPTFTACPGGPGREPGSHSQPEGAWHCREPGEEWQDQGLVLAMTSRDCVISPGSGIRGPGGLQAWARWVQVRTESTLKGSGWPIAQHCPLSGHLGRHGLSASLKSARQCSLGARPVRGGPDCSARSAASRALHSGSVCACTGPWAANAVKQ